MKEKEFYREKIVEIANEIENFDYLKAIYDYAIVPYNMEKEKKRD